MPGLGVKMAQHLGGSFLPNADSPVAAPGPADLDPIAAIAAKYMPRLAGDYQPSAFSPAAFSDLSLHHDTRR